MFRSSTLLLTVAAGASVVALSAAPAIAAPTYTVKAGTKTAGTTTYTAATTGASPQVKFAANGNNLSCTSSTAKGSVKLGSKLSGVGLGTITGTTWTGCIGPLNLPVTVTQTGTWSINATGTTTTAGVTAGTISGIAANVSVNQGGCSFTVSGSVKSALTTTATKQQLKVNPSLTLTLSKVVGCFGLLANGNKASIAATYNVKAASGKLAISNP